MKRYCQTMDLYDDPELIAAYVAEHEHVWEEVKEGFRNPAGYPAPTGGMGSPHGQIPEGPTGRFSAREMETHETDI